MRRQSAPAPETVPSASGQPLPERMTIQRARTANGRTKRPIESPVSTAKTTSAPASTQAANHRHPFLRIRPPDRKV